MPSLFCGYCQKKVDGMHQLFTMGGFSNPYGCKQCHDNMKERDELSGRFRAYYQELYPNPNDFRKEIMVQPEPKTPRYLALKWWRTLTPDEKQRLSNASMDANSQPRRNWQSLTGSEIERIFQNQKIQK
jgi:hypothetical protein